MNRYTALVALTALTVVAEANARDNNLHQTIHQESQEQRKWDARLQQAKDSIDRGLKTDHSRNYVSETTKIRVADRLLQEAQQYTRERREVMMKHTEECIAKFVQNGVC